MIESDRSSRTSKQIMLTGFLYLAIIMSKFNSKYDIKLFFFKNSHTPNEKLKKNKK
jgi:hypothetical protein